MSEEETLAIPLVGKEPDGTERSVRSHVPSVITGSEATRQIRDLARRRREAEAKLQQHLRAVQATPKAPEPGT
jgi:hypothetical protein